MSAASRAIEILKSINITLPLSAIVEDRAILVIKNSIGDKILSVDFEGNSFTRKFLYEVTIVICAINEAKTRKEIAIAIKAINRFKKAFKKYGIRDELTKGYSIIFDTNLLQGVF